VLPLLALTVAQRAAVGDIAIESSGIESALNWMIGYLLHLKQDECLLLLGTRMLDSKLDLLKELCLRKLTTEEDKQSLRDKIGLLKGLNKDRTVAIHGIWQRKGGPTSLADLMRLEALPIQEMVAVHEKSGRELPASELENLAKRLEAANMDLLNFFIWVFAEALTGKPRGA